MFSYNPGQTLANIEQPLKSDHVCLGDSKRVSDKQESSLPIAATSLTDCLTTHQHKYCPQVGNSSGIRINFFAFGARQLV